MLSQEHDNICILKEISSFMNSSKKKQLTNKQNMADLLTTVTAVTVRSERNAANTKITELEKLLLC